jgi:hypothetical protein
MIVETQDTAASVELSPPFAAGEIYNWHILIRDEFTTVSSPDTFQFSIDASGQGIACDEISSFQTRCRPGGTIQARLTLNNTNHTGETVEFTIDGIPHEAAISRQGRALVSLSGYGAGTHNVELTDPAACYPPVVVNCPAGVTAEKDDLWSEDLDQAMPSATALLDNYPNPFNPTTTFRYILSEDTHVSLTVYDMLGRLIATVVDNNQAAGDHSAVWDGSNESGQKLASGIYFYRLAAGKFAEMKRMLLVK